MAIAPSLFTTNMGRNTSPKCARPRHSPCFLSADARREKPEFANPSSARPSTPSASASPTSLRNSRSRSSRTGTSTAAVRFQSRSRFLLLASRSCRLPPASPFRERDEKRLTRETLPRQRSASTEEAGWPRCDLSASEVRIPILGFPGFPARCDGLLAISLFAKRLVLVVVSSHHSLDERDSPAREVSQARASDAGRDSQRCRKKEDLASEGQTTGELQMRKDTWERLCVLQEGWGISRRNEFPPAPLAAVRPKQKR